MPEQTPTTVKAGEQARPRVRWTNATTGEIKERFLTGVDRVYDRDGDSYIDEWELTPIDLALAMVPDLVAAIEKAFASESDLNVYCASEPR